MCRRGMVTNALNDNDYDMLYRVLDGKTIIKFPISPQERKIHGCTKQEDTVLPKGPIRYRVTSRVQ